MSTTFLSKMRQAGWFLGMALQHFGEAFPLLICHVGLHKTHHVLSSSKKKCHRCQWVADDTTGEKSEKYVT